MVVEACGLGTDWLRTKGLIQCCIVGVWIAEMSSRRRNLRRSARHRRRQPVAASRGAGSAQPQFVDLTCDDYNYEEQFVDLTDLDGSPIVIPSTPATAPATRNHNDLRSPYIVSDASVSDDDLPPVPFKLTAKPRSKQSMNSSQTSSSNAADTSPSAHCPVCLDSFSEVKAAGRQIMATTCGHVFCKECLSGVLGSSAGSRNCPTCRKKISSRSVHPLFIWSTAHLCCVYI